MLSRSASGRIWKIVFLALVVLLGPVSASVNSGISSETLRIHYQRQDNNFADLGLWAWDDCKKPAVNWPLDAIPFSAKDEFGGFVDLELAENAKKVSFLVVNRENGEKEAGSKVFKMNSAHNELWIREKDDNVYVTGNFAVECGLLSAAVVEEGQILAKFSSQITLDPSSLLPLLHLTDQNNQELLIEQVKIENETARISLSFDLAKTPLNLSFSEAKVACDLTWQMVDKLYAYDGDDLGCTMHASGSASLKLWAPRAHEVSVIVFDRDDQTRMIDRKSMVRGEKGVWSCELMAEDFPVITELAGYYYQFEVNNPGREPKIILDPYARSMAPVTISPDGTDAGSSKDFVGKAAFVDPDKIGNAPASASIQNFSRREDAVIYEIHVRDFTSDPEIYEDLEARWGTFAAFKSRLSYIKSLGVTHIQLLPVMAWYFGDETAMHKPELEYSAKNNQYNWGYDPHNYFSLDGAYSEKPQDSAARIAEFKDLVDAIHRAGMGVILDVVYTHMARADFLEDLVPNYYFFRNPDGSMVGDFGNNLATNRLMAEKLIVDSVKYWFETYRIDGMRWDMMGDATRNAVQKAFDAAVSINPSAIFIGEGWRTFKGHLEDPALKGQGADQDWMAVTDSVGVFSDEFRNELKSGFGCEGEPMFLTGGKRNIQFLFKNIKAQPANIPSTGPGDVVQYIEAHDNMPLFDVIAQSIKKDPDIEENFAEIHRRVRLGNVILMTSQGTAFMHAGQEFGRSKQWRAEGKPQQKYHELSCADGKPFKYPYFIHDSYDSSDAINRFNWKKATDIDAFPINVTTREYTSGLIKLRRSTDAFRLPDYRMINSNVNLIAAPEIAEEDLLVAYSCQGTNDAIYHVFVNADSSTRRLTLKTDLTHAEVLVDQKTAGISALAKPEGFSLTPDSIEIEPLTAVILRSKK